MRWPCTRWRSANGARSAWGGRGGGWALLGEPNLFRYLKKVLTGDTHAQGTAEKRIADILMLIEIDVVLNIGEAGGFTDELDEAAFLVESVGIEQCDQREGDACAQGKKSEKGSALVVHWIDRIGGAKSILEGCCRHNFRQAMMNKQFKQV